MGTDPKLAAPSAADCSAATPFRVSPCGLATRYKREVMTSANPAAPAPPPKLLDELAEAALDVANGAAKLLCDAFGRPREHVESKSSLTDQVSEVDRAAETYIATALADRRPDDGLLGEEGSSRTGRSGVRWVIDPLDGTTNYLFGIPAFAVSVAAEINDQRAVGVVVDVSRSETWQAVAGRGATCNAEPLSVATGRSQLATALVATGFGYDAEVRRAQAGVLARLLPQVRDIRRIGSAALDLCWVAGGRFDAFYERGLKPWDLAAGLLVAEEAGASHVTLSDGTLLVATPELLDQLAALLLDP